MQLKTIPEDFIVEEHYSLPAFAAQGDYTYVRMEKKQYTLQDAIRELSSFFGIPQKQIGYAGIKDKQAITTQVLSLYRVSEKKVTSFHHTNITLTFLGYANDPVVMGSHERNHFQITVRDITEEPTLKKQYINYFGEQRFSQKNKEIGKALVLKNYATALTLMIETNIHGKEKLQEHITSHPKDYITCLQKIPHRFITLYVHAYQSYLWNQTVRTYIGGKELSSLAEKTIPLIGFGYTCTDETVSSIIETLMEEEGITERDFINRQFPGLSFEGGERAVLMDLQDMSCSALSDDEQFPGKKKITLTFSLGTGSYATEVIKQLFTPA